MLLYAPGADLFLEELVEECRKGVLLRRRDEGKARVVAKTSPRAQRSQTTLEAFTIHEVALAYREARPIEPSRTVNPRRTELERAKEILAEIFGIRAAEVEVKIRSRLEERSWAGDQMHDDGLWPATFCLGE